MTQLADLTIARAMIQAGIPIFIAARNHGDKGREFHLPKAWQETRPNPGVIDRWKPGMALCAVTGIITDVLDTDLQNGGVESRNSLTEMWPRVYGTVNTPSGGTHDYITRTHLPKGILATGIDLQAGDDKGQGRGFVYLPPTKRVAKAGPQKGALTPYLWATEIDLDYLTDWIDGDGTATRIIDLMTRKPAPAPAAATTWTPDTANKAITTQCDNVRQARDGAINSTLGGAARMLGRFVAGGHLTEQEAAQRLLTALAEGGQHSDAWNLANRKDWTAATVIQTGLAKGQEEPWPVTTPVTAGTAYNQPGPGRVLPSPSVPMDVARELAPDWPGHLTWWRGEFYAHTGAHWEQADETVIRGWVRLTTERATYLKPKPKKKGEEDKPTEFEDIRWAPTITKVREVVAALGEGVLQRQGEEDHILALANGVLTLDTKTLQPHDPAIFNLSSRPFPYNPKATADNWIKFLDEVLPNAPDDQKFLQEWFGYVLSGRTDMHVIASLAGASRSGKGTILRVLTAMTGPENVAAGHLDSLTGRFGLEPLIGKTLLAFGDVRWANTNAQAAVQRLLEISGEDRVTVERKNRADWQGTLGTRIMFAGNETPRFTDPSRAMANRLRILRFTQSFAGREDHKLTDRLLEELPGIFNWALTGLDRLNATQRFTESARSADLRSRVSDGGDAPTAFADEYLEAKTGAWSREDDVLDAYSEWCQRTRRLKDSTSADTLRAALLDLFPQAKNGKDTRRTARTAKGPRKVRGYEGLQLLVVEPGTEFDAEDDD
jgi:putative DNA primase/helicase